MKTLVVGHVTHDHYEEGFVAGGCAFYGSQVHRRLSGKTHLLTVVGEDFCCDEALTQMDATVVRRGETTVFANYYPDDGPREQLVEAAAPDVEPSMVRPDWLDADTVHLAPVFGEVDLRAWSEASGRGLLAISIQGWLKERGPVVDPARLEEQQVRGVTQEAYRVVHRRWEPTAKELEGVDVACLSDEDLSGQKGLLERLRENVPIVAVTSGVKGSRVYGEKGSIEVGIYPTEAVDPTGAGDVYAAGFVHGLADGAEPEEAARFAAAAASIVVEADGGTALSRLDEAMERMRQVTVRRQRL